MSATSTRRRLSQLDTLEAEAVHIIREVAGELERPVLLFSGGKDSVVMLHLAAKAFAPAAVPFPVLHVDTGHNFPEVVAYRDEAVERYGVHAELGKRAHAVYAAANEGPQATKDFSVVYRSIAERSGLGG